MILFLLERIFIMGRHAKNKNFANIPIIENNYLFFYYPIFLSFKKKFQLDKK